MTNLIESSIIYPVTLLILCVSIIQFPILYKYVYDDNILFIKNRSNISHEIYEPVKLNSHETYYSVNTNAKRIIDVLQFSKDIIEESQDIIQANKVNGDDND